MVLKCNKKSKNQYLSKCTNKEKLRGELSGKIAHVYIKLYTLSAYITL